MALTPACNDPTEGTRAATSAHPTDEGTRASTIEVGSGSYPCTVATSRPTDVPYGGRIVSEVLSLAPGAVDLSRAPIPLIENHDRGTTNIGVVTNLRVDGDRLRGDVVLGSSQRALELAPDIKAGLVTGLSAGYRRVVATLSEDGSRLQVDKWVLVECSITPCPADIHSGIGRSLQTLEVPNSGLAPRTKGSTMTPEEIKAAQDKAAADAVKAERERASGIRGACNKAGQPELAEKLIADGVSLDAARALIIDSIAERTAKVPTASGIEVGKGEGEKFDAQVRGWLLEKSGQMDLVVRAAKLPNLSPTHAKLLGTVDTDGGTLRGTRMMDIGRDILEKKGIGVRNISNNELAKRALTSQFGERAGFAPASDFSTLYENVMYKILLASYLTAETTWQRICASETVSDPLRSSNRYRAGSFGTLEVVAENGEYKNVAIPDGQKFAVSTQKYGGMIGLSLEAMLADDMGANTALAAKFGRTQKLTLEKAFYALLAQNSGLGPTMGDGKSFYHADHGNIGVGSALSIAGLDADRLLMKRQMDVSNNEYLELSPRVLLVPTELATSARQYNLMQYSDVNSKYAVPNAVQGLFQDIVDTPRYTGTRRYTFADPASAPSFLVAFLEGYGQAPSIESQQGWRTDGIEWKVRFFAKVQAFDYKASQTNAGA